ncbi:MAG TPA: 16S rRNA (adenine(1518)-N(6)/adenine(1519)-N(6))-dimethyltransferase RsmA [bacterium]|nr:16S rRNA (adenine(1518)-N(6)/adenine(1519)-N(6))-dimethyltransferase RsmA [bacterium]HPT29737.1 16S rRNA (adenine(1518)-N(6)/adenine(1519)-N(6))-dimethyltransferase RsmA [bacterium]
MDLLATTLELAKLYDIHPSRSKGQNFLIDQGVYEKIIAAADIKKTDVVLEVGPGLGFLTVELAKKARRVIAVELDDKLFKVLQTKLDSFDIKNIELVNQDILRYQIQEPNYQIVANLPYNITSIFLRTFLSSGHRPSSLVLLLQKEVAERLCATPPQMSVLAVSVQFYGDPKIIDLVPAASFWPAPKVDSAIVKITLRKQEYLSQNQEKPFFRLVKTGFSAKRKMIKNNLVGGLKIDAEIIERSIKECGLSPTQRAQELSLKDWLNLFAKLSPFMV